MNVGGEKNCYTAETLYKIFSRPIFYSQETVIPQN